MLPGRAWPVARCSHCKGTGEAPGKITLECVECQRKVIITYHDTAELIEKSKDVQCSDCKKAIRA